MLLVLATKNKGKLKELVDLLSPLNIRVASLADYPLGKLEMVEDGETFLENAIKKATTIASLTGNIALADDSGLEVDFLNNAPGVHSARFAGEPSDDRANNKKLLQLMNGVPWEKRTARFRCVVVIATPEGKTFISEGTCEGIITTEERGDGGFGYDPLFYLPAHNKTFAELEPSVKNKISHRGKALAGALNILSRLFSKCIND